MEETEERGEMGETGETREMGETGDNGDKDEYFLLSSTSPLLPLSSTPLSFCHLMQQYFEANGFSKIVKSS
jgi:hypothetical protein